MFRRVYDYRTSLPVLAGLIFIAVCSNTVVLTVCPHLSTAASHCLVEESSSLSSLGANSQDMSHEGHGDMAMLGMAQEGRPVERSTGEGLTDSQASCSHCMMHSQSGANAPAPMVLNNSASQGVATAAPDIVLASLATSAVFVGVPEHGPPRLNSSRYILNSSFRI